ncbi:MAG: TlyA family RNA methyltransferase [Promethearchaeota archaeon]
MKKRLDILLVDKKLVDSRSKAQWLIKNGYVLVENKKISKSGKKIESSLKIELVKEYPYVSRGGLKLESALDQFSISVKEKICADIGSSKGGFTDCLIKKGASRVYSIDIATNFLHSSLTHQMMKEKIIPLLGIDARHLIPIEEKIDVCTIDVTFASLRSILPNIKRILRKQGDIIALVKPIFETEFYDILKFKIIQNSKQLYEIIMNLIIWCKDNQFFLYKIFKSPILGKEGSIEFFIHLKLEQSHQELNYFSMIKTVVSNMVFSNQFINEDDYFFG